MNEKDSILHSGILEQYVLGLLGPVEVQQLEQQLAAYPELREHVQALQAAMEQVLQDNAIAPPPSLKGNILSKIEDLDTPPTLTNSSPTARRFNLLTALVAGLAFLFAFGTYHFYQKQRTSAAAYASLEKKYQNLQAECAQQQALKQDLLEEYQFVKDPTTQHVHLRGTGLAPEALVIAYLNNDKGDVAVDIVNLPKAPEGKRYHLWADVEGEMIHMGDLKDNANALQAMKFIANAESLNITLEKDGYVEHPDVSQLTVSGEVS